MLAEQDRIVPINEPQIGLHLAPFVSDWPGWDPSSLGDKFTFNRVAEEFHVYFFSRRYAEVWLRPLRRLICRRISVYGDRRSIFVIKEPNGSQAADIILRAMPRAQLLFLLRDGRDVVDSELAASQRGSWMNKSGFGFEGLTKEQQRMPFLAQAARKWVWRTQVVQEAFAAHRGPKLLVRYEDLLTDTHQQLDRTFEWLQVPPPNIDATVDRHAFRRSPQHGPQKFVRAAAPGRWRQNLGADEQAMVEGIMGPKLREMGYE